MNKQNKESKNKTKQLRHSSPKKINKSIPYRAYSPVWVVSQVNEALNHDIKLIDHIRDGVKKADWKQLINEIGHTEKELESILPSSISSMQKKDVYDKETSERIYELAMLYSLGYQVFDTKDNFRDWLMSPSQALGDKIPFELLDSSFGFQVVHNAIVRIQYNVYS